MTLKPSGIVCFSHSESIHSIAQLKQLSPYLETSINMAHFMNGPFSILRYALDTPDIQVQEIERLLAAGADANACDDETPLTKATSKGYYDIVRKLLEYKADMTLRDRQNNLPVTIAEKKGHYDILALLEGPTTASFKTRYVPALQAAILSGANTKTIQNLLNTGAGVNDVGGRYATALAAATKRGSLALVRKLLENGAKANVTDSEQNLPINIAAYRVRKFASKSKAALDAGDAHLSMKYGDKSERYYNILMLLQGPTTKAVCVQRSPIIQAAILTSDSTESIETLAHTQGDVNVVAGQHGSALGAAVALRWYEVARMLLPLGAKMNIPDSKGRLPIRVARENGDWDILRLLEGPTTNPILHLRDSKL